VQQQLASSLALDHVSAKLEAQLLLQHVLHVNRAWLIAHENDDLDEKLNGFLQTLVLRRLQDEPLAYILNVREFYGLSFKVTADTLIPRPDTETLVDAAFTKMGQHQSLRVLDLGTGSGAIALAIAKHRQNADVLAVDYSAKALNIAKQNALDLKITNCQFLQSDWYTALPAQRFDVIVCNPPYIEDNDAHLNALKFEPISALVAGKDGLDDIRKITENALVFLNPQAWLLLEHGYKQAQAVQDLLADAGLTEIQTIQDLGGNDRVTMAKNPLIFSHHWD
jgi:release factor glutamine methyltransferase